MTKHWKTYISATCDGVEDVYYWTGSGLSTDFLRAKLFGSRSDAFSEWNEHSGAFPGWTAALAARKVA
jgi:hypothetical protein